MQVILAYIVAIVTDIKTVGTTASCSYVLGPKRTWISRIRTFIS